MARKAPRQTPQRILGTTLALFNRFGEPNVSTTLIASSLGISPGNLYYHFPSKDTLIDTLYDQFERDALPLLEAAGDVGNVEDAWFFLHTLFELVWDYRFLYRDLNDLLSKNRRLEQHFQALLQRKRVSMQALLDGMARAGALAASPRQSADVEHSATTLVVLVTYWLSYEYVLDPRRALEGEAAQQVLLRGAHHALGALAPYLVTEQRLHLLELAQAYAAPTAATTDSLHPT